MTRVTLLCLALLASPLPALAKATPRIQVYFQATVTDARFQERVFQKVARHLRKLPQRSFPEAGRKAVVQAVLGSAGELLSAEVSLQSGSPAWDAAALAAVKRAAPFGKLPASLPTLEIHFHFSRSP